jgi:predicted transcriptional regulator
MITLALDFMDDLTLVSAELVAISLANRANSQNELAAILGIQQSAVSQRKKRARLKLVVDLLGYYQQTVQSMKP